jgi:hypothetical protein
LSCSGFFGNHRFNDIIVGVLCDNRAGIAANFSATILFTVKSGCAQRSLGISVAFAQPKKIAINTVKKRKL